MKNISTAALLFLLLITGCKKKEETNNNNECAGNGSITSKSTRAEDESLLSKLSTEIYNMSGSATCQRANEWRITALGSKPCGGPAGYIAYRAEIDVDCFLKKVNYYTTQTAAFNKKYGLISDCSVPLTPKSVTCSSGLPVFVY